MKIKNTVLSVISCLMIFAFSISAYAAQSDIAIIGGADGPTAIFVAEPNPTFLFIALAVAIISLIIVSVILIKRRKK
ncbi:MAG: oxaloacetate decarboxylase [Clostridia bacterium]|nr:oxaloacetate decarboxylase [Clostridia bacterium]